MKRIIFILAMLVSVVSWGYGERFVKTFEYRYKLEDFPIVDVEGGFVAIISKDKWDNLKGFRNMGYPAFVPSRFMIVAIPGNLRVDTMYWEGERVLALENPKLAGVSYDSYENLRKNRDKERKTTPLVPQKVLIEEYGSLLKYYGTDNFGILAYVNISFSPFQYDETDDNMYFYPNCKLVFEFEDNPDASDSEYPFYGAPLDYVENLEDAIEIMTAHGIEKYW